MSCPEFFLNIIVKQGIFLIKTFQPGQGRKPEVFHFLLHRLIQLASSPVSRTGCALGFQPGQQQIFHCIFLQ
jgi:hypothetical protein